MGKDPNFTGQPIFTQLLGLLDRSKVSRIALKHDSDRYYKRFKTYDHLVTMLYAVFHKCTSLREVTTGMQACSHRLQHLGLTHSPRRSTLSDANRDRPSAVFESIYREIYGMYCKRLPDSQSRSWHSNLYIIDSTTIKLFKEILKNAGRTPADGKRKGGIKVHTMIKADEDVPCLVKMTAAASHDVPFIQGLSLPKGAIVTFDKGYIDYKQYDLWTQQEVNWVTRARAGYQFEVKEERFVSEEESRLGVLADQLVILGHQSHQNITRTPARIVKYHDEANNKIFEFITNNTEFAASTIALIYQQRWQIELLFKRLKQNFPLQYFLGDNENAIRIQIWCALIADLILKIVQSHVKRPWNFSSLSSMIRIHLMSYTNLFGFLENPDKALMQAVPTLNKGPSLFQ